MRLSSPAGPGRATALRDESKSYAHKSGRNGVAGNVMASNLLMRERYNHINMKRKIHIGALMLLLVEFAAATTVKAQGTLFVSNLGSTNLVFVGLGPNYWMAQPFETGSTSSVYTLDSVQLLMLVTGPSSGTNLQVSLYSNNGGVPGISLAPLSGSDPTSSGVCTYTASGALLAPSTTYWILASSGLMQFGFPVFLAGASQTTNYVASGGWSLSAPMYSTDLATWQTAPYNAAQIAIRATAPEPSTYVLAGLGLAMVLFRRSK
jgi:hypothetical protein